jgi:hypothetical protein
LIGPLNGEKPCCAKLVASVLLTKTDAEQVTRIVDTELSKIADLKFS